jgi:uncharacterized protein YicC (UPF0701 family)
VAQLAAESHMNTDNLLSVLLKLPDVVTPSTDVLSTEEWQAFEKLIKRAIAELNDHRKEEGKSLEADLLERIHNIQSYEHSIAAMEPERRKKIKDGLVKVLEENVGKDNTIPTAWSRSLFIILKK